MYWSSEAVIVTLACAHRPKLFFTVVNHELLYLLQVCQVGHGHGGHGGSRWVTVMVVQVHGGLRQVTEVVTAGHV